MPSDWIKLGGIITNLANALDVGYRYVPSETVAGKDAAHVLKQVDKVLQGSRIVLENHKDVLSPQEYEDLKHTYRRYHWQMTDESQEFRATTDERIRQSRILSQLYANRYSHEQRARNLLRKVEAYQTTVLAASRNATVADLKPFDDELPASSDAATQSVASDLSLPSSYTSWFSVPGRPASSRSTSLQDGSMSLASDPDKVYEAEDQSFIVTVTHFPKPAISSTGEEETGPYQTIIGAGEKLYRRMISFERGDQRIEIKDTRSYALNDDETYVAEETLQQMSELGQRLLNQSDLEMNQTLEPTVNIPQSSSLEATIQKFRKVSIANQE